MNFQKFMLPYFCLNYVLVVFLIGLMDAPGTSAQQNPSFELPVQLIGFPIIVLSVRLTNFFKKLGYSLSPKTYGRRRRSTDDHESEFSETAINLLIAERQILKELGPKACIMEEPCKIHASRIAKTGDQPDWTDILRNYKVQSSGMKQNYLLSVFLGDVIRNVSLCRQLAKRLPCNDAEDTTARI